MGLPWISTEVGGVTDLAGALQEYRKEGDRRQDSGFREEEKEYKEEQHSEFCIPNSEFLDDSKFSVHERGILVDSGDSKALAEAIAMLVSSRGLGAEIAKNGKSWVHSNYSKERLIADIENLYERLTRE